MRCSRSIHRTARAGVAISTTATASTTTVAHTTGSAAAAPGRCSPASARITRLLAAAIRCRSWTQWRAWPRRAGCCRSRSGMPRRYPQRGLQFGQATGSAMPLAWTHAEFVKLVASRALERPFDRPEAVWRRYRGDRVESRAGHLGSARAHRRHAGGRFAHHRAARARQRALRLRWLAERDRRNDHAERARRARAASRHLEAQAGAAARLHLLGCAGRRVRRDRITASRSAP